MILIQIINFSNQIAKEIFKYCITCIYEPTVVKLKAQFTL